jgi:hypothetical protein
VAVRHHCLVSLTLYRVSLRNNRRSRFFYALISLLNIVAFFGALREGKRRGESLRKSFVDLCGLIMVCQFAILKGIMMLLAVISWYLPEGIFRCLPLSFKSKVRFGRRYAVKSGLGIEQKAELGMKELKSVYEQRKKRNPRRFQGGLGQASPLSDFLGVYDMLLTVAEDLHHSDILSLSRVAKSVREAVLPANEFDRRIALFQRYTCLGTKTPCWMCDTQTCTVGFPVLTRLTIINRSHKDCQHTVGIHQVQMFHHFDECRPFCSPCFHHVVLSYRPAHDRRNAPHCSCAPSTRHPNVLQRWWYGSGRYNTSNLDVACPKVSRAICVRCNSYSKEELMAMREKRTKMELKKGLKPGGGKWTHCANAGCLTELGTGPRWWVCGKANCLKECRNMLHKSWGRGEKAAAVIVGEHSV